jgi:capsule polysaccharide export protein KpsC/LpsZ
MRSKETLDGSQIAINTKQSTKLEQIMQQIEFECDRK